MRAMGLKRVRAAARRATTARTRRLGCRPRPATAAAHMSAQFLYCHGCHNMTTRAGRATAACACAALAVDVLRTRCCRWRRSSTRST
jgi:hypothetical protein